MLTTPDRLTRCADCLLRAMDSPAGDDAPVNVWTGKGRPNGADCFTLTEYIEAMTMLQRLGLAQGGSHAA